MDPLRSPRTQNWQEDGSDLTTPLDRTVHSCCTTDELQCRMAVEACMSLSALMTGCITIELWHISRSVSDIAFVSFLSRSRVHNTGTTADRQPYLRSFIPDNSSILPSNGNQNRKRPFASLNGYTSSQIGTCSAISKHIHFSLRHRCLGKQRGVDVARHAHLP